MKIGFIGLGKLGLPVALAIESKGHQVIGTDINDTTLRNIRFKTLKLCGKKCRRIISKI
jgi:UDP-N-acetyl-D-mannosaminuronate dehydrogenase